MLVFSALMGMRSCASALRRRTGRSGLLDPTIGQAVQASIPLPTNPEDVERVLGRLTEACAAIPDQYAVPTLVVLAMHSWWHGNGTLSRFAVDRALTTDPRYQLALLVERMLNLGHPPTHPVTRPHRWPRDSDGQSAGSPGRPGVQARPTTQRWTVAHAPPQFGGSSSGSLKH